MSDAWKAFERQVARYIGGTRILRKGEQETDVARADGRVVAECKYRSSFPQWLSHAWDQVKGQPGNLHLVALKKGGMRGFYILIHSDDFRPLLDLYLRSEPRDLGRLPDEPEP